MFLLALITWIPGLVYMRFRRASLVGMDHRELVDGRINLHRPAGLDRRAFADRSCDVGMGKVEDRGRSADPGRILCGRWFRSGHQCRDAYEIRTLIDLTQVMGTVWAKLFRQENGTGLTVVEACTSLAIVCLICLWLLTRRVRAFEVVK